MLRQIFLMVLDYHYHLLLVALLESLQGDVFMTEIRKSQWGKGPWQNEPDRLQWVDKATGLTCLALRGPVGSFCGYVGVPETHPAYEITYDGTPVTEHEEWRKQSRKYIRENSPNFEKLDFPKMPDVIPGIGEAIEKITVHGGLTYSGFWPDKVPGLWFFGFDCAHSGDLCPGMVATLKRINIDEGTTRREDYHSGDKYCTIEYVQAECTELAAQLAAIGSGALWTVGKLKTHTGGL